MLDGDGLERERACDVDVDLHDAEEEEDYSERCRPWEDLGEVHGGGVGHGSSNKSDSADLLILLSLHQHRDL